MAKRVLITGANAGIGKESARQLALDPEIEKIFLGVRNLDRGRAAQVELEQKTQRNVFELLQIDVSDADSARKAVSELVEPIDTLVLNAGGIGGANPRETERSGASKIAAVNLVGHAALVEELIKQKKLTDVVVYAGSETARGAPKFGIKKPTLHENSVEEYKKVMNGEFFSEREDVMNIYAYIKYLSALWMSSLARKYPEIRFVTVSPGATSGTNGAEHAPALIKFLMTSTVTSKFLLPAFGMLHGVDKGAARYVSVIKDQSYESGAFYGSTAKAVTGPLVDQGEIFEEFRNLEYQDNAYAAIHSYL